MAELPCPITGDPSTYHDGNHSAGDIVVAAVRNPIEDRSSRGKLRPFILVNRVDGHWRGMGLTTNPRYASGLPRLPIPNFQNVGLNRPGYLWGDRLTNVAVLDIHATIGRVDTALADAVIALVGLRGEDATAVNASALRSDYQIAG